MNRKIKFRAKHFDTGQWVYGSFIQESLPHGSIFYIHSMSDDEEEGDTKHRVDYRTVGEFTGRKDIKNREIFEGSRVKFMVENTVHAITGVKKEATGTIRWDSEDAGFYIDNDCEFYPHVKFWNAEKIEVVGNIYDNLTTPHPTTLQN